MLLRPIVPRRDQPRRIICDPRCSFRLVALRWLCSPSGEYLTSHYREVGPLVPYSDLDWEAKFTVWERRPTEVFARRNRLGAACRLGGNAP